MPYPSNALTVPSIPQSSPATPSGPWASGTGPRVPPDILTYSYASRMVYVAPGDTYDHAIDVAKESFIELKDIERERISLEVNVLVKNQQVRRMAEIGRTAWSLVVASLARFEIVEIRVARPLTNFKTEEALSNSSSQSSSTEPPPYASDKASSLYSDSQSSLAPHRQTAGSQSSSSSFTTRVVELLTHKSSRSHLSQSYNQF